MKFKGIVLLLVYSLSTFASIGVLYCNCTQSQQLVILSSLPSCPCSESDTSCCSHDEYLDDEKSDCDDDDECHLITYQYVKIDQMQSLAGNAKLQLPVLSVLFAANELTNKVDICCGFVENNLSLFITHKIPLIYVYNQLRL